LLHIECSFLRESECFNENIIRKKCRSMDYKFDLFKFVLLYDDGYNAVIHIIFLLSFISMWNYTDKNLYLVNICNFSFFG